MIYVYTERRIKGPTAHTIQHLYLKVGVCSVRQNYLLEFLLFVVSRFNLGSIVLVLIALQQLIENSIIR